MVATAFVDVAEVAVDTARAGVYEHGWQSWSPVGRYPVTATSLRPLRPQWQTLAFRPGKPAPDRGFQGEGLLAVDPGDGGAVRTWLAPEPRREVASIRARLEGDRLVVSADGAVRHGEHDGSLEDALAEVGTTLATAAGLGAVPSLGPAWCSWYCYWGDVTEADVLANLAAADRLGLDIRTVQVDDGHQAGIGDWLQRSPGFGPLDRLGARIRDSGRQAGLWTAPFLVGMRSRLAAEHPDWLVGGAIAAEDLWGQQVRVLDVTHPDAAEHLSTVFRTLVEQGFDYHKVDFLFAGAMDGARHADATGIDAYVEGLRLLRDAIGPAGTLLGCGAPLLPSIGAVDAMRVGPDIDPAYDHESGDISQPSQRGAVAASRARAWMHARLWVNDPDCLLARPQVERRDDWGAFLDAYGALAVSSDPLDELDDTGLELTRRILRPSGLHPLDWTVGSAGGPPEVAAEPPAAG